MGIRIFNGSTQPLVPAGRWGEGVVMPGEHIEVQNPSAFGADQPGSPWTTDAEASAQLDALKKKQQKKDDPKPADSGGANKTT